jgi:hypothetical protein
MQSLNLGLQSLNHSDLSLKFKTALKCISAAVEGILRTKDEDYSVNCDDYSAVIDSELETLLQQSRDAVTSLQAELERRQKMLSLVAYQQLITKVIQIIIARDSAPHEPCY